MESLKIVLLSIAAHSPVAACDGRLRCGIRPGRIRISNQRSDISAALGAIAPFILALLEFHGGLVGPQRLLRLRILGRRNRVCHGVPETTGH